MRSRLLLLFTACLLTSCSTLTGGKGPATQKYRLFIDAGLAFSIKIPPGWSQVEREPGEAGYLPYSRWWRPKKKAAAAQIQVTTYPRQELAGGEGALLDRLHLSRPGLKLDPPQEVPDAEGWREWTGHWQDRRLLVRLRTTEGRHYLIVVGAPTASFDTWIDSLRPALDSFRPLPGH